MNAADAESILPLYRAGRRADGRVQKAVRLAEGDEALRRKLSDQMEFDERMGDVIHSIKPPEDLRQKLREVSARPHVDQRVSFHLANPAVLTAVLGVLVLLGLGVWTVKERMERFPGRENVERMLSMTSKMTGAELETMSAPTGSLGDWFYMRGFEGYALPRELSDLPAVGSRVLRIEGHPIAQLAVDRQSSILYVFRAADFGVNVPAAQTWKVIEHEGWAAALRREGPLCYVLAQRGSEEELKTFLLTLKR